MKHNILLICLLSLGIAACTTPEKTVDEEFIYDIHFETECKGKISDSVGDIKLVLLESNAEAVVSSVAQVFTTEDGIVIYDDDEQKILRFDTTGHFVKQIGRQGQGSEEYVNISNIDLLGNQLCMADMESKTLVLDWKSNRINKLANSFGDQIAMVDTNTYVVYNSFKTDNVKSHLTFYDPWWNVLKDTFDIEISSGYQFEPLIKFYRKNRQLFFIPLFGNSIYEVKSCGCQPYICFKFVNYQMPPIKKLQELADGGQALFDFMKDDDVYIHGFEPKENDKWLYVRFWTGKRTYVGFYNSHIGSCFYQETTGKQNDLFLYWVKGVFKDYFVSPVYFSELTESVELQNNQTVKDFISSHKNADEDDKVLVYWRFK